MISGRIELNTDADPALFIGEGADTSMMDIRLRDFLKLATECDVDLFRIDGTWRWVFDIHSDERVCVESLLQTISTLTEGSNAPEAVTQTWREFALLVLLTGRPTLVFDIPILGQTELNVNVSNSFSGPVRLLGEYQVVPFKSYVDCLLLCNEEGEQHIYTADSLDDLGPFEWLSMEYEFAKNAAVDDGSAISLSLTKYGINILTQGEFLMRYTHSSVYSMIVAKANTVS
ncbi:hypothetical protein [Ferrimicrobium acidiphilum]|jgi:hypothetical protein|uniref:hypothetical protein n=1 Tax=Ferrimicrobium acidiphilum TaxID=121039 RepID=UPI0023EF8946|nr:hypothetical protein [Ferrimicrobium acidiphilum]